jgi:hypothetical protein
MPALCAMAAGNSFAGMGRFPTSLARFRIGRKDISNFDLAAAGLQNIRHDYGDTSDGIAPGCNQSRPCWHWKGFRRFLKRLHNRRRLSGLLWLSGGHSHGDGHKPGDSDETWRWIGRLPLFRPSRAWDIALKRKCFSICVCVCG